MACYSAKGVELAVSEKDVTILRDDDTLSRKLLLEAHGAGGSADTDGAGGVDTNEHVLCALPDGDRLGLDLRCVNDERGLARDVRVNDAEIKRKGQRVRRF